MIRKYSYLKYAIAGDINSPEFQNWFKGSVLKRDGQPIVLYHQTSKEAERKIFEEGYRLDKGRARISDESMPDGIFLKYDEKDIGVGAVEKADRTQMPFYVRLKNPLVVRNREELVNELLENKEYYEAYWDLKEYDNNNKRLNESLWEEMGTHNRGTPEKDAVFERLQKQVNEWSDQVDVLATKAREIATRYLKQLGYDGVIMENDAGSFNRSIKTVVVFSTAQIRSAIPEKEIPIRPRIED